MGTFPWPPTERREVEGLTAANGGEGEPAGWDQSPELFQPDRLPPRRHPAHVDGARDWIGQTLTRCRSDRKIRKRLADEGTRRTVTWG